MTEQECFEKLLNLKFPDGFRCAGCGSDVFWMKPNRRIVICRKCRKEISPLAGTLLSRSRISLENWFEIIYMVTSSPDRVVTAKSVFEEIGLGSYRTAWEAMNKIRFSISHNDPKIRLKGKIEFDEVVISGIGSEYNKVSILGALEIEGEKRLTLQMIKNPDEMNIKHYLKKYISRKVTVITNPDKLYIVNWLVLNRIKQKSSVKYYGAKFMSIHIILQDISYGLRNGHHGISEKYLQRNLDEYVFTFNHNDNRAMAYEKVLSYMVNTKMTEYRKAEREKKSVLQILTRS